MGCFRGALYPCIPDSPADFEDPGDEVGQGGGMGVMTGLDGTGQKGTGMDWMRRDDTDLECGSAERARTDGMPGMREQADG